MDAWACQARGVRPHFIDPGKPMQNGFVESFNDKFRYCAANRRSTSSVSTMRGARIEAWQHDYSEQRPHRSIGRVPPAVFAVRQHNLGA